MSTPTPSPREPGEHTRTVELLNDVFAFDPPLTETDLSWYYDDNPLGPASIGRVEGGGRRLGNYALVPLRLARGDGHSVTVGVGVDLAVSPAARGKGTFRATVEDSYARGRAGRLDAILGVANANSAPRMVSALGWRALPELPVRVLLPSVPGVHGRRRDRYRTERVTPALLASPVFDELAGGGFDVPASHGFAPVWTPELLRWRLAKPRATYWLHASEDTVAVSTVTHLARIPFAVLLATLRRAGAGADHRVDGGALVRHLMRVHRAPFVLHFGRAPQLRAHGITLPRRFLPSPLVLVLHPLGERLDARSFTLDAFEFLDFDAY